MTSDPKVTSVRAEVDAGDRDLLVAGSDRALDLTNHFVERTRSSGSPRLRDDAVAAALIAAGLDAQRERRPTGNAWRQRPAARPIAVHKPTVVRQQIGDQRVLVLVAHHVRDVRQFANLVGPPGRVAARHHDPHARIVTNDATNGLPRALICSRSHGAGVDDEKVSVLGSDTGTV